MINDEKIPDDVSKQEPRPKWEKNRNNINILKDNKRTEGDGKESPAPEEEEKDSTNSENNGWSHPIPDGTNSMNSLISNKQQEMGHMCNSGSSMLELGMAQQQINNEERLFNIEKKLDRIPEQIDDRFGKMKRENEDFHKRLSLQVSDWNRNVERWEKLQQEFSQQVEDALQKVDLKATQLESSYGSICQEDKHFTGGEICVGINCPCPCPHKVNKNERGPSRKKEKEPKKAKKCFATAAGGGGGGDDDDDGSSDGSSSEDDNGIPRTIPNGDPWEDAISREDEECIASFLRKGQMPLYKHLKLALKKFQRTSDVIKQICDNICTCISRETTNIITVVPSYNLERQEDIIFVVYIRTHSQNICYKDFFLVTRVLSEYSSEGLEIARIEDRENLAYTENEVKMIETSTTKFTEELFRKHSNLQMISPSHFRSSMYEKDNPMTEKNVCIALYVPIKGYIPLTEDAFPTTLDGIPTDVREGGFEFFSKANEWHTNLKMGCEISGDLGKTGTIGPFIEQNGFLYFLTSAHVLFDPNEIPSASTNHEWKTEEAIGGPSMHVYQPKPKTYPALGVENSVPVGKTNFAFYKKGDDRTPGMEVAVVKMTDIDRKPLSGDFPDPDERMEIPEENVNVTSVQKLVYETGDIVENEFIVNNRGFPFAVIKFGAESGNTTSLVKDFYSSVGGNLCDNDGKIALYNQIMISEMHDGVEFAKPGDSGALILASIGGHLRALGLLVGRGSTGRVLATPMYAILDELTAKYNLTNRSLMTFPRQPTSQIPTDSGVSTNSLPESIQQEISQEVAQHSKELGEKMETGMTTKIENVKKEIENVVKTVIDVVKGEVKDLKKTVADLPSNMMSMFEKILQKMSNDKKD